MHGTDEEQNFVTGSPVISFGQITDQPAARSYRTVLAATCLYALAALAVVPFSNTAVAEIPALTPIFSTMVLTTDLCSGFLLLMMFRQVCRVSLLILGCAYLFAGSMALLNLLTFPGVLPQTGLTSGSPQSAAWAILLYWVGYAFLTLVAVLVECFAHTRAVDRTKAGPAVAFSLLLLLTLLCGITLMTTRFVDLLPALMRGSAFTRMTLLPRQISVAMMLVTVALGLFVAGRRSTIFLWLSLAVTATLCVNILTLSSGGRNTLGWTLGRVSWVISACVLFLFFMTQFAGQLRSLARAKEALEQRVQERTADLTRALRQRDLLLREVYHRVKNNMQVINSMLFLEGRRVVNSTTKDMIDVLRNRVFALGLVHQQLMSSDNLELFGLAPFMRELVDNLGQAQAAHERGIGLEVVSDDLLVNLDIAIPIGLVTTELVSNSIKHSNARHITVGFRLLPDDMAALSVVDDGTDRDTETDKVQASSSGQGSLIIAGLVKQLDGRLVTTRDAGTRIEVILPLPQKK